jgi:large conductance mechanosensitive channel
LPDLTSRKVTTLLKGFRDFVLRGNIVDLAIAVVIGTAFAKVVDSLVTAIITPILNALPGVSVDGLAFSLRGGALKAKTTVNVSAIITSIIVFLLTAAVVYFVFVVPMTKIQQLRARGLAPEPEAIPEATLLLREIRDALGARPLDGTAGPTPQQPDP